MKDELIKKAIDHPFATAWVVGSVCSGIFGGIAKIICAVKGTYIPAGMSISTTTSDKETSEQFDIC